MAYNIVDTTHILYHNQAMIIKYSDKNFYTFFVEKIRSVVKFMSVCFLKPTNYEGQCDPPAINK